MASEERGLRWLLAKIKNGLSRLRGERHETDLDCVARCLAEIAGARELEISPGAARVIASLGRRIIADIQNHVPPDLHHDAQIAAASRALDAWMRRQAQGDLASFCARHGVRVHAVYYEGDNAYSVCPTSDPELLKFAKQEGWRFANEARPGHRVFLEAAVGAHLKPAAARFVTAVAEYLCAEILDISSQPSRGMAPGERKVVRTQHLFEALRNDSELNDVFPPSFLEPCCAPELRNAAGSSETRVRRLPDAVLGIVCGYCGPRGLGALCRVVQKPVAARVRAFAEEALKAENARRPILELVSGALGRLSSASPGARHPLHVLELWERLCRDGVSAEESRTGAGVPADAARAKIVGGLRASAFVHCLYHLPAGIYERFEPLHEADRGAEADETVALVSLAGARRVLFAVGCCESNTCSEGCWCTGRYVVTVHALAPVVGGGAACKRVLSFAFGNGELAQEWEAGFFAAHHPGACTALGIGPERWGLAVRAALLVADLRGDGVAMWNALEALQAEGTLTSSTLASGFGGPSGGEEMAFEDVDTDPRFQPLPGESRLWLHHLGGLDAVDAFPNIQCEHPSERDGVGELDGRSALRARCAREPWKNAGSPRLVLDAALEVLKERVRAEDLRDLPRLCGALAGAKADITSTIVDKHEVASLRRRFSSITRSSRR